MESRASNGKRAAVKQRVNRVLLRVADTLTGARLLGAPLLVALLWKTPEGVEYEWLALGLILALQATDVLDGYLARQAKGRARIRTAGELLDPIADKLYINGAYLALMALGRVPVWLAALVVARDVLIVVGWVTRYLITRDRLLPNILGKIADTVQVVVLCIVLLRPPAATLEMFFWLAAGLTLLSGLAYARMAVEAPREARP